MGSIVVEPDDLAIYASSTYNPEDNFSTICISVGKIGSRGVFHGNNPLGYSLPLLLIQLSLASLVILLSSRILKHLGQPSMVPQILGGIILGPSVLGRAGGFTEQFFPLRGFIILDALAVLGYIFYFFLIGVQVDTWILKKIDKRDIIIGFSTVALALALSISSSFLLLAKINVGPETAVSLPVVAITESALSFPMIAQFLTEQKMINSEFGRLALSCSFGSNLFSFCIVTLTVLMNPQSGEKLEMLNTICGGVALALVMLGVVRPIVMRMLRRKTKGESLTEEFIYVIFVGVLVSAFVSQAIGLHMGFGPLVYGLVLPAGPPLGSAVVEKLELINSWLFMPLYFLKNGLVTNIFSVDLKSYLIVQYITAIAWVGKFIGALVSSLYCSIPYKDAILLGLVMNVQGVLELGMYKMMKQAKEIDHEAFIVMCTSMLLLVSTISPLIRYLYEPSKRYAVYNQRTMMHLGDNSELRIVACIYDQENVPTVISLLEAMNPSKRSPVAIYALHLIELVGRSNPLLIPHKLSRRSSSKASLSKSIVNAFRLFEQSYSGIVSVHAFTAISPYVTMHDEICTMALDKKASLIILPFHGRHTATDVCEVSKKGVKIMSDNILEMAPCSIAIIVDRGLLHNSRPMLVTWSSYRVAILFLGGADDREALAIGARMAGQPNINLTMVRLLENGSIAGDNSMETKLDNEVVSEFRLNMAGNHRAKYIEELAKDGTETVAVLRSMENNYELIIVGRRHEKKSPLIFGLMGFDEETELGEVGYVLASSDFCGSTSILVVQQHCIVWNAKDFNADTSRIEDKTEQLPMYRVAA